MDGLVGIVGLGCGWDPDVLGTVVGAQGWWMGWLGPGVGWGSWGQVWCID